MPTADHLSEAQFAGYRNRTLVPDELLFVDRHLATCEPCRTRLWQRSDSTRALGALHSRLTEHLDYDQVVACADVAPPAELAQHLAQCELCQAEVADLQQFRRQLLTTPRAAAVVVMPVRAASRRLPAIAAIAAALALAAGLGLWTLRTSHGPALPPPEIAQAPPPAEPALPPEQQAAVQLAISSGKLPRAPILDRLISKRGVLLGAPAPALAFDLTAPLGTTVLTDRPTFRWQPVRGATAYVVSVFDADFKKVAESPALTAAEWRPEHPLARGRVLNWQVTATVGGTSLRAPVPPAPQARFQVARGGETVQLEDARRAHPEDHLLLAVLMANAGALDDAARELDSLAATHPATAQALRQSLLEIRSNAQPFAAPPPM